MPEVSKRSSFATECIAALEAKFPLNSKEVYEYIDECEHQDGYKYWDSNFDTINDMLDDFCLYAVNAGWKIVARG